VADAKQFFAILFKEKKEKKMTKIFATIVFLTLLASGAFAQGFSVVTLDASAVSSNSACLTGQVIPNQGVTFTGYAQFKYGPVATTGTVMVQLMDVTRAVVTDVAPFATSFMNTAAATTTDEVFCVGSLFPSTTYAFWLDAGSNALVRGNVVTFTTLAELAPFITPGYGTGRVPGSGNIRGAAGKEVTVVGENFGLLAQVLGVASLSS